MNGKIVAAFLTGAVLASGIVYMAIRPATPAHTVAVADIPTQPPAPQVAAEQPAPQPPAAEAKPRAVEPPAKPAAPQHAKLSRTPIHEKPSPMPANRREAPAVVARNEPPPPEPPQQARPPTAEPPPVEPPAPAPPPPPPPPAPEPVPVAPVVAKTSPPPPEVRQPHTVTLTAGTQLTVRIGETVSASRNQVGDTFFATLERPLVIDGFIICERGSRVIGKIVQAIPAGKGGGQSHLSLELTRLHTSDDQRVEIRTDEYVRQGSGSTGSDLAKIGAGAVIGAAIGAAAGGGKGAAIGAGAGAAAGTGVVLIGNGKSVEVQVEARVTFRVKDPVTITEKLD